MSTPQEERVFAFAGFSLDARQRRLFGPDGRSVPLTGRAFDTLLYLVEHPDQLIDKQSLMKAVWPRSVVEENNLNQNISIVRRALGESPGENRFIVTVPGRGFRFAPLVTRLEHGAQPGGAPATGPEPVTTPGPELAATAQSTAPTPDPTVGRKPGWRSGTRWVWAAALVLAIAAVAYWLLPLRALPSKAGTREPSIAVLPFANLSGDKEQEYFSDGLTEELSAQLGQLRGLRVIGRGSAFSFKNKNADLRLVGKTLGADRLLEGSVRRSGNELRITADLVDARTGERVWSQIYDRKLDDVFAIQRQIAGAVATQISASPESDARDRELQGTSDVAAYDAYLSGVVLTRTEGSRDYARGIEQLEKAVALDPQFVQAWSRLALAYNNAPGAQLQYSQLSETESLRRARDALSHALQVAPGSTELLTQAAAMSMEVSHDWSALEHLWNTALNEGRSAHGHFGTDYDLSMRVGGFLVFVGRPHAALELFRRAQKDEPLLLPPSVGLVQSDAVSRDFDSGDAEYARSTGLIGDAQLRDDYVWVRGMSRHSAADIAQYYKAYPEKSLEPVEAWLYHPEAALRMLRQAYEGLPARYSLEAAVLAEYAAYFDDPVLSQQTLDKAFADSPTVTFIFWRPVFAKVRSLPAFKNFVRKLRLVDYWRATGDWGEFCHPLGADDFECR